MEKENLSITETFALALQHHERNELQVAEQLYKQILKTEPDHIESIFRLGSLKIQTGNFEQAQQLLNKVVKYQDDRRQSLEKITKQRSDAKKALLSILDPILKIYIS